MRQPGVYASKPEFSDLVDPQAKVQKVAEGFGATAGPVFSRIGFLRFSDLLSAQIFHWEKPATSSGGSSLPPTVFRTESGGANGLTFDHQGRLLTCESKARRVTRTEKDGSITVLADRFEGQALAAPRDLVYAIDGSIYFCDAPESREGVAPGGIGEVVIYRIARSQVPGAARLERVSREYEQPTGVALSPRQDRLFISDARRRTIHVHLIRDDGTLEPGTIFAEFKGDEPGTPGGLKTDERGNVYAAGPGGLSIFHPSGTHLGTIVVPELPTNVCWGAGFSGLYITAGGSLYYIATRVTGTKTY